MEIPGFSDLGRSLGIATVARPGAFWPCLCFSDLGRSLGIATDIEQAAQVTLMSFSDLGRSLGIATWRARLCRLGARVSVTSDGH